MHILDPAHPEQEPRAWPYPRPGEANASVRLGVIAISGGGTRWIEWDRDAFPYLCSVVWPSEGPLTVLVQDREQEREQLLTVDPANGATSELLTEEDEAWLNLDQSVPRWLAGGEKLLWSSEREGRWALELRRADGSLIRRLTPESLDYRRVLALDTERGTVWIAASEESSETHVYRVPLNEGDPVQVTETSGEHSAVVSRDGSVWVHTRQTEEETVSVVRRLDGEDVGTLPSEARGAAVHAEPQLRDHRAAGVARRDRPPARLRRDADLPGHPARLRRGRTRGWSRARRPATCSISGRPTTTSSWS